MEASPEENSTAADGVAPANSSSESPPPPPAPAAPRRDKLAAMAQRAATAAATETADVVAEVSPPAATTTTAPPQSTCGGGRGSNKLAALAARQQQAEENADTSAAPKSGGKNLNRLGASSNVPPQSEQEKVLSAEEQAKQKALYLQQLQERMTKRNQLLENLDQAEEMTCKLLNIASQTTDALQNVHWATDGQEKLQQLSSAYCSTIQAIHPLICGNDAERLVKAYQNHGTETKRSMYGARVEWRLAQERMQVIKTFAELERQQQQATGKVEEDVGESRKRSREGPESG